MQPRQRDWHLTTEKFRHLRLMMCLLGVLGLFPSSGWAVFVDEAETIRLNGRMYNRTAMAVNAAADNTRLQTPYNSWNMLQNRTFIQMEIRHNLTDLVMGRASGPLSVIQPLLSPLSVLAPDDFEYFVTYRGEYDGVWDYGPDVFSERFPLLSDCGEPTKKKHKKPRVNGCTQVNTRERRRSRHRLFEAYVNYTKGPLFVRVGRQNLSWGETDVFRLMDQINPLDAGFGGFLVALDERRVPLDMLRVVYGLGGVGPLSELNLEGFVVMDDEVSTPVASGSPWSTPNRPGIRGFLKKPARNFTDARGGGRIVGVLGEFMFSLAHYYTYLDGAAVRIVTPTTGPALRLSEFQAANQNGNVGRYLFDKFQANVLFPKIQISGASLTFGLPKLSAVVRSEFAYFYAEPFFKNSAPDQLLGPVADANNFALTPGYRQVACPPGVTNDVCLRYKSDMDRSDVIRWALGMDMDRYIPLLNPQQSFLISGQIFGTHILDFDDTKLRSVKDQFGFGHFAIPVFDPHRNNESFVNMDQHQLINTLSISTAYRSGAISPALVFLYDWQGAWLVQPGITFTRDPFRFVIQYNYIDGQFNGIGFLRDRDNLIVQMEVVI